MLIELVNVQSTPTIFKLYLGSFSTATFTSFMRSLIDRIMKPYPELV